MAPRAKGSCTGHVARSASRICTELARESGKRRNTESDGSDDPKIHEFPLVRLATTTLSDPPPIARVEMPLILPCPRPDDGDIFRTAHERRHRPGTSGRDSQDGASRGRCNTIP